MRETSCLIIIFLMLLPAFSTSSAQEIEEKDGYFSAVTSHSFKVENGGRLTVRVTNGRFTIDGWNRQEVKIEETVRLDVYSREEAERQLTHSKTEYEHYGANVNILRRGGSRALFRFYDIKVPQNYNIKLKTSSGDINVSAVSGDLQLSTTGGDLRLKRCSGTVSARTSGGDIELETLKADVDISTAGGNIMISGIEGKLEASTSGGDIELENTTGAVRIRTAGGDLFIRAAKGKVRGSTSGGSIHVEDCGDDVKIRTSGGNLRLRNIGGDVDGRTSGGDIDGTDLRGQCDFSTSGGDITVQGLQAGMKGRTSGGSIEVEMTLTDFTISHAIDLNTASGHILLRIPAKLPADIYAEIRLDRGIRRWGKRRDIYSDFPLTKATNNEGRRKVLISKGRINGGGDSIFLSTSNGDIIIEKLK